MKLLVIDMPVKRGEGAAEAVFTFTNPKGGSIRLKLRMYGEIHTFWLYERPDGFSWGGPNQSDCGLVVDDSHNERAEVRIAGGDGPDTSGMEVTMRYSSKVNQASINFPEKYNWVQIDSWAIPIP